MIEDALPLGLALPVGDHLTLVGVDIRLRDMITLQLTGIEGVEVFHGVTGQFWECRHCLGHRPALSHNQLVVADIEGLLLADLIEVPGPQHGRWHRTVVLLIKLRLYQGALYRQRCRRVHILLSQPSDAVVHAAQVLRMFNRIVHLIAISPFYFLPFYFFTFPSFASYTSSIVIGFLMVPRSRAPSSVIT